MPLFNVAGITAVNAATQGLGDSNAVICAQAAMAEQPNAAISAPSYRAALKACKAALADKICAEDRTATLANRGIILAASGQTDAAIADFDAALARDAHLGMPM